MCRPSLRYEECYSEHGGPHRGGGGTKSSLRGHATGRLLLRQVPESPAPVSRGRGHHPAQEHVHCASGHSAGKHLADVIGKASIGSLLVLPLIAVFLVPSSRASLILSFLKGIYMIFEQWQCFCVDFLSYFFVSVQQFMELEPEMLATETIVPVYFALEDDELLSIYTQTLTSSSSQGSLSAAEGSSQKNNLNTLWKNDSRTVRHSGKAAICNFVSFILLQFCCIQPQPMAFRWSPAERRAKL